MAKKAAERQLNPHGKEAPIYLSPHFDDAAFSLGSQIVSAPGGILVNIYTRSAYVAGPYETGLPDPADVDRISALRDHEDASFASRFGLKRIHLGAEEPRLRGRGSRDASGVGDDIAQIEERLSALVLELSADRKAQRLYCPAAIGGHVNHLATRAVVIGLLDRLPGHVSVSFYEDLPYARSGEVRRRGVSDLRAALSSRRLRRRSWPASSAKLELINLYSSQHEAPVRSLRRFSPRALWPLWPHEAVWDVAG